VLKNILTKRPKWRKEKNSIQYNQTSGLRFYDALLVEDIYHFISKAVYIL